MNHKCLRVFLLWLLLFFLLPSGATWAADPIANAGGDFIFTGDRGGKVVLDGAQSVNAGKYRWQLLEGPNPNLSENLYPYQELPYADTPNPYFRPGRPGIYRFGLWVTGEDGKESYDEVKVDFREPLHLRLRSPRNIKTVRNTEGDSERMAVFTTYEATFELTGFAVKDLTEVQCTNSATGEHYIGEIFDGQRGGKDFIFRGVELAMGDNRLEIIGEDDQGTTVRSFCWITRNNAAFTLKETVIKPDLCRIDEEIAPVTLKVSVATSDVSATMPEKLELYEVDGEGKVIQKVTDLFPEDLGSSERTYSGMFVPVQPDFDAFLYYRAKFKYKDMEFASAPVSLEFLRSAFSSSAAWGEAYLINVTARNKIFPQYNWHQLPRLELEARVEALAEELRSTPGVRSVVIYNIGRSLITYFNSGMRMGMSFDSAPRIIRSQD